MAKRKPALAQPAAANTDSDVADARAALNAARTVVTDLETKLGAAKAAMAAAVHDRGRIAFDAHTGNADAAERLAAIHTTVAQRTSECGSLEEAGAVARDRVTAAEAAYQRAVNRAEVAKVRAKLAEFRELSAGLDKLTGEFFDRVGDSLTRIGGIASIGPHSPRGEVIAVMSDLAIRSAAMKWRHILHMDSVPPGNQCTFEDNFAVWARGVEKWCADREAV